MLKLLKVFVWLAIAAALLIGLDQFLLRVPLKTPGLHQAQQFYVDFRGRLFNLTGNSEQNKSIERMIESSSAPRARSGAKGQHYLYVDENGALQFADSLEQVPSRYRKDAQPLGE